MKNNVATYIVALFGVGMLGLIIMHSGQFTSALNSITGVAANGFNLARGASNSTPNPSNAQKVGLQ